MPEGEQGQRIIVSYLTLRRMIGLCGILLPVILAVGDMLIEGRAGLRPSISAYYDSGMRDAFVGILFSAGLFLLTYRGHEPVDNAMGSLACFLALGVALLPVTSCNEIVRALHLVSGAGLFLVFAVFSIWLFTKTKVTHKDPTPQKLKRNKLYRVCGWVMVACVGGVAVCYAFPSEAAFHAWEPVFWLESIALWAFGWSWMVKGETLMKDD